MPEVSTRSSGLWRVLRFGVKNGSELFSEDRLAVKPMDCISLAFRHVRYKIRPPTPLATRCLIILSRPTNAPLKINKTFDVSM